MANKNLSVEKRREILNNKIKDNEKKYEKMTKIICKDFIIAHNQTHAKMDTFCIIYEKSEFVENIYFFKFFEFPKIKEFYDFSITTLCEYICKDLIFHGISKPVITYKDSIDSYSRKNCYRIYCEF